MGITTHIRANGDCSDLYDNAAEKLKRFDNDINKSIQDLAKNVEARGVPKNRVARQVVKELTVREILSLTRIYKGLGVKSKRRYRKRVIEEAFPHVVNIPIEESTTNPHAVQVLARSPGHSETLTSMNRKPDVITEAETRGRLSNSSEEDLDSIFDKLSYDELLRLATGTAKKMIPLLCKALKRENPNYTNCAIREVVTKDCLPIWQKSTIMDAMPEEHKQKEKVEYGRKGREMQLEQAGSHQSTEFASFDEIGVIQPANLRAESGSVGQVEDVSEDFSHMNRGQDVITEKGRAKMLSKQLEEAEVERGMLKNQIDDLKNQVKTLSEKSSPELLKEIEEKFADQKGILDAGKLQKIGIEAGKNLVILVERYNSILQEAVERGKPVPFGTYILTKPELKLVPVRIMVDFNRKRIWVELWEKRLQSLSR